MVRDYPVEIAEGAGTLAGMLALPPEPIGVVLFAHGSGSSRHSPRNQAVAAALREAGVATLLLDLLTPAEDALYRNRFDIDVLASRLHAAARWLGTEPLSAALPLGLFGASTGAAAALRLAADSGSGRLANLAAVVSRGGRPDLAGAALAQVQAPTLLIVGGADTEVLELNRRRSQACHVKKRWKWCRGKPPVRGAGGAGTGGGDGARLVRAAF